MAVALVPHLEPVVRAVMALVTPAAAQMVAVAVAAVQVVVTVVTAR